ncbi:hypothetical protein ACS2BX_25825 [Bacillus cereus group sp. BceL300]|uniref:hypothetical protein n=1 Tax=Bacillus cereus group TaxID=86661 RepID=UPI0014443867|nr:hypothetical protein [Bacillus cereus]NKW77402.1 hypothetical protein [Bacillus cereus]NKX14819.1 hypothetical protein [Bacillus cereus]
MILIGGKNTGKKLVNKIAKQIEETGSAQVAAVTEKSALLIDRAIQKVANTLRTRLSANPESGEVTINGEHRLALVVTITKETQQ